MRIALLSDIHGNPIALDAVLADVAAEGGADAFWVLGDLAAIGYDPAAPIRSALELPNVRFGRGNTDRYLVTGERPGPTLEDARRDPDLLPRMVEMAHSFAWTQGYLTAAGWLSWLADLPLEQRLTLPDGTRLLGVHAAPGLDDGPGVHPGLTDADLGALLAAAEADLICVAHTHVPLDRSVAGGRVVNLGSVSNPLTADLRASYVLLDAAASGYRLRHRQVAYDLNAVIAAIRASRHPTAELIVRHFRGEIRSPWVR
jgi:predicted phosphodiesterase